MIGDVDIGILNQDEYDLDFIVEDDGDSAQVLEALPAEFRRGKNKELFAIFIHYLICTALNPNFPKQVQSSPDLEDFLHAVHYVDDQIKSRLNLLVSAVWKPDFKHDLEAFPIFNLSPHEPVAWCDACGMSGRYSSRRLYLSGVPYDKNTFKWRPPPLPAANSGSDSETSTNHAYDIGRYCAMRSKQYHILYHHKKSLFDSVAAEIEDFEETRHLENERQNQRRISSSEMDNIRGTAESDNGDEDGQKEELIFRNLVERGLVKNVRFFLVLH
ncbi:hypothetical protein BKA69DRAFT_1084224 [Paraphysoderma sedebokerense]|nr:hypothetical protein BKA69DRAFT_1084224 [Paraphysoderma sedebokerense]